MPSTMQINESEELEPNGTQSKTGITSEKTNKRVAEEYVNDLFNFATKENE